MRGPLRQNTITGSCYSTRKKTLMKQIHDISDYSTSPIKMPHCKQSLQRRQSLTLLAVLLFILLISSAEKAVRLRHRFANPENEASVALNM